MDFLLRFQGLLAQLTEGLANLTIKNVLLAVGVMLILLTIFRLASRRRDSTAAWLVENLQVVLSVVVVVFLLIRPFLFQAFYIPSSSMEPTLMGPEENPLATTRETTGDRLLVNKLLYRMQDPHRLDIVVFKAPPQASPEEKEFIKRVVGLPGETIAVAGPRVKVDGKIAFRLGSDQGAGLTLSDRSEPRVDTAQRVARLKVGYSDAELKVIAEPDARLEYNPHRVVVNGKVELEDASGQIVPQEGLGPYGGDGNLKGTVYLIQDEPRLAVITGQRVEYEPGHVEINGRPLPKETYIKEAPRYTMEPRKLAANEYFMMGDNRNNSNDSHVWGPLTRDRVIGRAEILFWPINRASILHWWLVCVLAGLFVGYQLLHRLLGGR